MQALKITIPGDFWDVQIYRGRLHLWTMAGSVLTLDWSRLVDALSADARSPLAIRVGFGRGEVLYGTDLEPLRAEPEFRMWLLDRFRFQGEQPLNVSAANLREYVIDEQENPLQDLPLDTDIYERAVYASTDRGLWKVSVGQTKFPLSTRPQKLHDVRGVSLKARSRRLAIAAGGEGLFEREIDGPYSYAAADSFRLVAPRHCEGVDWAFSSMFGVSTVGGGFFVGRYWELNEPSAFDYLVRSVDAAPEFDVRLERGPRRLVDAGTFDVSTVNGALASPSLSWAAAEKIYTLGAREIATSRVVQRQLREGMIAASEPLGTLPIGTDDAPVSAGASYFGTIVEFDDSVLIVSSDESQTLLDGAITRWRTYPRSTHYENHLHLIYDDHIDIFAFYGDYLADQRSKHFGSEYRSRRWR